MFLIDYVTPEKAEGAVADVYNIFPPEMGVPDSLQVISASPALLEAQGNIIKYFMGGQEELGFHLLAAIRFMAASHYCHDYCTMLNAKMLQAAGLSEEEVNRLSNDPSTGFEEKEAALLAFVIKALDTPEAIGEDDIATLRELGWSDNAIFDAVGQAGQMASASLAFRTFTK